MKPPLIPHHLVARISVALSLSSSVFAGNTADIQDAAAKGSPTPRQVLYGHIPLAAKQSFAVGRPDNSKRLHLAIGLPLRNQQELARFLKELSDPSSANYRKYLTPAQFTEKFGPTEKDYRAVIQFAKIHGLTVTGRHPNRVILDVEAAVP